MALDFVVGGGAQFAEVGTAPLTAVPLSFSCWANQDIGSTGNQTLMGIVDTGVSNSHLSLQVNDGGIVKFLVVAPTASGVASATGTITKGTDFHAAAVTSATNNRIAYRNGANPGTNSNVVVPTSLDAFSLGGLRHSIPTRFFNGPIWEAAIWNIALTAAEVALLATGLSPKFIRPEGLIRYWDCIEVNGADLMDQIGANRLAITGATRIEHPRRAHLWPDPITGQPTSAVIGGAGVSIGPVGVS